LWLLKITGSATGIFCLKSGKNHFGLMELQISIVNIAKSGCTGVFEGAESVSALKTTISTIQKLQFHKNFYCRIPVMTNWKSSKS